MTTKPTHTIYTSRVPNGTIPIPWKWSIHADENGISTYSSDQTYQSSEAALNAAEQWLMAYLAAGPDQHQKVTATVNNTVALEYR